ncbi:MAG: hypothetical protein ABFS32_09275 [Bacteroidota bacterium]
MRIFLLVVSAVIFMGGQVTYAQQSGNNEEEIIDINNAISFVPQYIYRGGIRLDYERRLKNDNNWIVFATQFFSDFEGENRWSYYNSGNYADYNTMIGFGLNIYFKKMVYVMDEDNSTNVPKKSIYLAAGPGYQYYFLKNTEEVAVPYIEDGITYYEFTQQDIEKPIHRVGVHINGGVQFALDKLLVDIFFGVISRYSLDGNGEIIRDGYQEWTDIDFSGTSLDGGVRIGFFF